MKISTEKEQRIADRLCEIADNNFEKFYRISEMLIRRIARRQLKM
jgi:hypothetical protein